MNGTENIKHLPDEDEHWIFLVWAVNKWADGSSTTELCAVDTTRDKAIKHKEMAEAKGRGLGYPKTVKVYIEERWTNHYFGRNGL